MKSEDLLDILKSAERGLTTGEVLQRAEISRPTARRHLEELVEIGKLERWDLPGTYLYFLAEKGEEE
jgi:DNA-binding IclR family transcriptional regulator